MKKRILSILLVLCLICGLLPTTVAFAAGGSGEFAGGTGAETDPYLISTKAQLDNVRNYLDAHFKMTADIVFTDADFVEGGDYYNNGSGWEPIGDEVHNFTGTFDGDGHTITGLYQNISASTTVYVGLFGYIYGATIENLGMVDSDISVTTTSGEPYAGGIVGYSNSSTIINCANRGNVSAESSSLSSYYVYAGGIAGYSEELTYIANCTNSGVISADDYAGGIVGYTYSDIIENCHNSGAVIGNNAGGIAGYGYYGGVGNSTNSGMISGGSSAGGIVGYTNYCAADYSVNSGTVSANYYAGGIVGCNYNPYGNVAKCYNSGTVSAGAYAGGIAGRNYSGSIVNCYNIGESGASNVGGIAGYSSSNSITNCYYLSGIREFTNEHGTACTLSEMQKQSTYVGFDFDAFWTMGGKDYPFPVLKGVPHVEMPENTTEFAGGKGTLYSPYLISDKAHLNNVRNYLGACFKITADIEFSDADFAKGGKYYNGGAGWTPIGDVEDPFTGVFDGNGYAIKGLYQNVSTTGYFYGGLFGYTSAAVIANLGMVDSDISVSAASGKTYTGGIVGYANSSTNFMNCYNAGVVSVGKTTTAYVGGLAGYVDSTVKIAKCNNAGTVKAEGSGANYVYAGGIAGGSGVNSYGNSVAVITDCHNSGNVYAIGSGAGFNYSYAGGIVGYASKTDIRNCYSGGAVDASGSSTVYAGGVIGYGSSDVVITNSYNSGTVNASASGARSDSNYSYVGGIVGYMSSSSNQSITDCYNIGSVKGTAEIDCDIVYVGGIMGYGSCDIANCNNKGAVSAFNASGLYNVYAGGISGYGGGHITECYNAGNISVLKTRFPFVGGITGYSGSNLTKCYNVGDISVSGTSNGSPTARVGGIAGYCYGYSLIYVEDCYNAGGVSASNVNEACVGGIIGLGNPDITRCYSVGTISSSAKTTYFGGIAGDAEDAYLDSCYYIDSYSAGVGKGTDNAVKCTATQMKKQSTFVGFDFDNVWTMEGSSGYSYPELRDLQHVNPVLVTITKHPQSVTADVGAAVKFSVSVEGTAKSYQWQYRASANGEWKNTTLAGYKTATLSVTATTARNGYQYRCVVTDANGNTINSEAATLTVNPEFEITSQPKSVTAESGEEVTFTVKASGSGLKYQWQYRTSAGGTWTNTTLTGSKTATLSVSATTARNGYQYRCVITDSKGTKLYSNAATLTVNAKLVITQQPASVTAELNDNVKFTVKASGSGLKYQWQYRTSANGTWAITTLAGNKTATLSVTATAARNGYQYRCKITDAAGNVVYSNAATLTVNAKLEITQQPADVNAELNDSVTFTVKASGSGLKYQWQYRSKPTGTWATTTLTGSKTATLSATATAARNGYQYRCKITDAAGNVVYSNAATLTVNAKLEITAQPEDVSANLNDSVSFTVKASGSGLKYQWQYRTSASGTWKTTTLTGNKTATLSATATAARNGYQYRCKITDAAGNVVYSNAATLTVGAKLEITAQPEDVSANLNDSVTFTVKASGSGLKYQWQYRTSASGTWKTTTLTGNKTATLSATATATRNGYQYRCIITDANGNTVTSDAVTLTVK